MRSSYLIYLSSLPFGICAVAFDDEVSEIRFIPKEICAAAGIQHPVPVLTETEYQIRRYFNGSQTSFDLPLQLQGTDEQLAVWNALRQIPYGNIVSCGVFARSAGLAGKSSVAAQACRKNPIPLIIPCHRVVGAEIRKCATDDDQVCGIDIKRYLLAHERCRDLFIE